MIACIYRMIHISSRWEVLVLAGSILFAITNATDAFIPMERKEHDSEPPRDAAIDTVIWRADRVCGLNCLYLLLRCAGKSPDYHRMERLLVSEEIASLDDIQRVAKSYECNLVLRKLNPRELQIAPKPVIAHLDVMSFDGKVEGHFVLVISTSDDGVDYVDGTTVETLHSSWPDFKRSWSGYVAYQRSDGLGTLRTVAFAAGCGAVFGLAWSLMSHLYARWKSLHQTQRSAHVS